MSKRRAILVGAGGRAEMYRDAMAFEYPETVELVGLCDINPGRMGRYQKILQARGKTVPGCAPEGFEQMIRDQRADLVVVVSKDATHDDYIVRGMLAGCDIITEKPMTIDAARCQRIVDTIRATGKKVRVTFNYRYSPVRTQVKELLQDGVIGRILSVEFKWLLDTSHGADYFRRWHRNKANSGGLMVHKATHHFDLVNWFINSVPARVTAIGARRFYTPEQAERYGFTRRTERCLTCPEKVRCPFCLDIKGNPALKAIYFDNESYDGYVRDRCVFSPDIDIEDSMNVNVAYRNGVTMSYALTAFSPWEGYHIVFNGTKGRLEHICRESSYVSGDGTDPGQLLAEGTTITVMPHFTRGYRVPIRQAVGGHGGGDSVLLDDLYAATPPADPLKRRADHRGGSYSILTGVAANIAMKENRVVVIDELVSGLEMPDYPDESKCDLPIKLPEFITEFDVSALQPKKGAIARARLPPPQLKYSRVIASNGPFVNINALIDGKDGVIYFKAIYKAAKAGKAAFCFGGDGPSKIWVNGEKVAVYPELTNPAGTDQRKADVALKKGKNELIVALDSNGGKAWGIYARFAQ